MSSVLIVFAIAVMDAEIGQVVAWLKESGQYDNTFIFFASDNGAEGTMMEALPILGEDFQANIKKYFDNSLDNIGHANSFTSIGPAWAQAATAPNRMYKVRHHREIAPTIADLASLPCRRGSPREESAAQQSFGIPASVTAPSLTSLQPSWTSCRPW